MSPLQDKLYWRLWAQLRRLQPAADRKAIHSELGLPESHTMWSNGHLDRWKQHVLAQTQPANANAQIRQEVMPQIRKQWYLRHLLAALNQPEEYAECILTRMQRKTRQRTTGAGRMITLDTAGTDDLQRLLIALKKECRRDWPTKDHLLGEIRILRHENDLDEATATAAVLQSLALVPPLPPLEKLDYEQLLLVLGTLRSLANGTLSTVSPSAAPKPLPSAPAPAAPADSLF